MIGFDNMNYRHKAYIRNTVSLVFLTFISFQALCQQVWPVQVTGSMIPPRSLDLGVYSVERSQDLVFNATLNDPIQASLPVRLSLTIESNNQVVYKTDPNFLGPSITLAQFEQLTLDGIALQQYLTPSALVGAGNNGMGSLEIPEGFNKICLEVYGIDRNVPISRKFCVQGSFQLNQSPQLSLPTCQAQMKYPETQNLIFNWTPMHIGSSNSPMPVEYLFELVRLPDGVTNANDAFETSMQVYQTTSMTPSLLYSQMEPLLEPNKIYAWRVKAYSLIHPTSKLFQNDGFSEICTFMYYDEDGPLSGSVNDKPAPAGCEVFDTDYGAITSNDLEAVNIVEEDIVKLGYFDMLITQAISTGQGFSGTGLVTFPMLRSKINVSFSGLRVNNNLRVVEAQEVYATVDQQFKLDPSEVLPITIADNVDPDYIEQIDNFFANGNGINRLVSNLDPAEPQISNLPIGLDQDDKPTVAIIGINFTPRNAYLNMVSWQENDGNLLRLAGTTIPATPFGIKTGAHLVALDGASGGGGSAGTEITPVFNLSYAGSEETKMDCSCQGYKDMTLEPNLAISTDIMREYGSEEVVLLKPKTTTDNPETYLGELKNVEDFTLVNLPDFEFKPKKAYLDLDQGQSLSNTYPNTDYNAYQDPTWRGLVLEDVEVVIPKEYDFTGNDNRIKLDRGELFIDENDLAYGRMIKTDMLSLEDGKMGNWAYSVDTFGIQLTSGEADGASMVGQVKVPVFSDLFSYSGALEQTSQGFIELGVEILPSEYKMDMWKASFLHNVENSSITAKLIDSGNGSREFFPNAKFNGVLSIDLTNDEFSEAILGNVGQKKAEVSNLLGITNLDFEFNDLLVVDFEIDPFVLPADRYKMSEANYENAYLFLDGKEFNIGKAEFIHEPEAGVEPIKMGLSLVVYNGNNKVEFIFWAKEALDKFVFEGIEINTVDIKCECTSSIEQPSKSEWDRILNETIDKHYRHLFDENAYAGSLASLQNKSQLEESQRVLRKSLLIDLNANALHGFPVLPNGNIVINFLNNQSLSIDNNNRGEIDGVFANRDNYTFSNLDAKANDSGKNDKLPIDVSDMWDELGIKGEQLPDGARLLITDFQLASDASPWQEAKMELMLVYEINRTTSDKSYLRFSKGNVSIGSSSVNFTSLFLHLENEATHGQNEEIIFFPGDGSNSAEHGSYAFLNCTDGFKYFNVQGLYKVAYNNYDTKIKYRYPTPVNEQGETSAQFGFTVNTESGQGSKNLNNFIAPVNGYYNETEFWNFVIPEAEHLIFHSGDGAFEAYLDFDQNKAIQGAPSTASCSNSSFKGILFKSIEVQVDGLKSANGDPLNFPIQNVVYKHAEGVSASLELSDALLKSSNALLGGWKYAIDDLKFEINNSVVDQPLNISGSFLVPFFRGELSKGLQDYGFNEGWIPFSGDITFDATGGKYEPTGALEVESVSEAAYLTTFVPGMSFSLEGDDDEGEAVSTFSLNYNGGNKEFEPSCDLSGTAAVTISSQILKDLDVNVGDSPLDQIVFNYDLLTFQEFKINDPETPSNCTGENSFAGIKSIDFGTWGVAELEGDQDDEEETTPQNSATNTDANKPKKSSFMEFPISVSTPRFACINNNQYKFTLPLGVNLMRESEDEKDKEKTKTAGIKAEGELGFIFNLTDQGMNFEEFQLGCLLVEGQYGPAEIVGGLNILRKDENATQYGSGFKAMLDVTIKDVNIMALGQFGSTNHGLSSGSTDYRYFFIDLEGTYDKGIPLGHPAIRLYGLGGGFRYNMEMPVSTREEKNSSKVESSNENNDDCALDNDLLEAGVTLTGETYSPKKDTYGATLRVLGGGPKPETFLAEVGVDAQFKINTAGTLSFTNIQVNGDAFLQPSSIKDRRVDHIAWGKVELNYDVQNKKLVGDFGIKFDVKSPNVKKQIKDGLSQDELEAISKDELEEKIDEALAAMPSLGTDPDGESAQYTSRFAMPYPSTDSDESDEWAEFEKGSIDVDFNSGKWAFKFGKPTKPAEMFIRSASILAGQPTFKTRFYFQAGHDLDPLPSIAGVVPGWDAGGSAQQRMPSAIYNSGNGFIFGAGLDMNFNVAAGPFEAYLNGGLGFDMSMIKFDNVDCGAPGSGIGFNNWYMQGQAYAYMAAGVDLNYDLGFKSGKINIFNLQAALALQAKFPNPNYFSGRLQGSYSVLNGLLKGKANIKIEIGELCEGLQNASKISIPMVSDIYPSDDSDKVSVFAQPKITTNLAIGYSLPVPNYNDEGALTSTDFYRAEVGSFVLAEASNNSSVPATFEQDDYQLTLKPDNLLKANTEYKLSYNIIWKEDKGGTGNYQSYKVNNVVMTEDSTVYFTTGAFPDVISSEMLEYQAPGYSQRYWHKDYADPMLKFNTNDPKLSDLFVENVEIDGTSIPMEYIARITEYSSKTNFKTTEVAVVSKPDGTPFEKPVFGFISIGTVYKIPTIKYQNVTVNTVNFPGLNDLNLNKGKLCQLEIIRKPSEVQFKAQTTETTDENGVTIVSRALDGALNDKIAETTKILYQSHFGTSKYNSLHEKLATMDVEFVQSKIARVDLNHPKQETLSKLELVSHTENATWDDYFAFVPPSNGEGIDAFDLRRIRKNIEVSYKNDYPLKEYLYFLIDSDPGKVDWAIDQLSSESDYREYMKEVMSKYDVEPVESDGTRWHYNFFNNPATLGQVLSSDEISNKTISNTASLSSSTDDSYPGSIYSDTKYALMYQDIRSRIVIQQARWIAELDHLNGSPIWTKAQTQYPGKGDGTDTKYYGAARSYTESEDGVKVYKDFYDWPVGSYNQSHVWMSGPMESRLKYHGEIEIKFPEVEKWRAIDESVVLDRYSTHNIKLKPKHSKGPSNLDGNKYLAAIKFLEDNNLDGWGKITSSDGNLHDHESTMKYMNHASGRDPYQTWRFVPAHIQGSGDFKYTIENKNGQRISYNSALNRFAVDNTATSNVEDYWQYRLKIDGSNFRMESIIGNKFITRIRYNSEDIIHGDSNVNNKNKWSFQKLPSEFEPSSSTSDPANPQDMTISHHAGPKLQMNHITGSRLPEYLYIHRNNKPHVFWSATNNIMAVFKENDENDIQIIPNIEFPTRVGSNLSVILSDHFVGDGNGFEKNDIYKSGVKLESRSWSLTGNIGQYGSQNPESNVEKTPDNIESMFGHLMLPYKGIFQNVPGIIPVDYFDWGGPGIAYSTDDKDGVIRPEEFLKCWPRDGKEYINLKDSNDWVAYSVNVKETGNYRILIEDYDKKNINYEITVGDQVSQVVNISNNSSDQLIKIDKTGLQKIKIKNTNSNNVQIYHIEFIHLLPRPFVERTVPCRIELEDYDYGGDGIGYKEYSSSRSKPYRSNETAAPPSVSAASNGHVLGYNGDNEWSNYTFDVNSAGKYIFDLGYAGSKTATIKVEVDNQNMIEVSVPSTGSYTKCDEKYLDEYFLTEGTHTIKVTTLDNPVNLDYLDITPSKSEPKGGSPLSLPGRIEFENHDTGGEGVAFHDKGNINYFYDYSSIASGKVMSGFGTMDGEWFKFTVKVTEAQNYSFFVECLPTHENSGIELFLNDEYFTGLKLLPIKNFDSRGNYFGTYFLPEGTHTIKAKYNAKDFQADFIDVIAESDLVGHDSKDHAIPGKIEFEDLSLGGQGIAYFKNNPSESPKIQGNNPKNIGSIGANEWLKYPIDVAVGATYKVKISYAAPHNTSIGFDIAGVVTSVALESTGGSYDYSVKEFDLYLPEGKSILKTILNSGYKLDYLEIVPNEESGIALNFDGVNDRVAIDAGVLSALEGNDAISIEYWFKGTNSQYGVSFRGPNSAYLCSPWEGNKWIMKNNGGTKGGLNLNTNTHNIYDGDWHHIAMTWQQGDSIGFNLYVDGISAVSKAALNTPLPTFSNAYIGYDSYNKVYTTGSIDDVRIWNRALTANEILNHQNCNVDPAEAIGLLASYNFDKSVNNSLSITNSTHNGFDLNDLSKWIPSHGITDNVCEVLKPTLSIIQDGDNNTLADNDVIDLGQTSINEPISQIIKVKNTGDLDLILEDFTLDKTNQGVSLTAPTQSILKRGEETSLSLVFNSVSEIMADETLTLETNDPNQTEISLNIKAEAVEYGLNRALHLDGSNDKLEGSEINLQNKPFTVEFWAKRNGGNKNKFIVSHGSKDKYKGLHIGFKEANLFIFGFYNNDLTYSMPENSEWHHWACVYDGSQKIIYRDGTEVKRGDSEAYTGTGTIKIGTFIDEYRFFKGSLDEVRVWDKALTGPEIYSRMRCKLRSNDPNLKVHYTFDNNSLLNHVDQSQATQDGFSLSQDGVFDTSFGSKSEDCVVPFTQTELVYEGSVISDGTTINFGELDIEVSDKLSKSIGIKNTGNTDVTISSSDLIINNGDQHFIIADMEDATLAPGQTTNFKIEYQPSSTGSHNATFSFNKENVTTQLNLTASRLIMPAKMIVSNNDINFGTLQANQNQDPISITISNSGESPLNINGANYFTLTGDDADQFEVTVQNGKNILQNGEEIIYVIKPMANIQSGANFEADFVISSNSESNPQVSIPITMITLTAANMVLSIDEVNFGAVQADHNLDPISITVSNSGESPLNINEVNYFTLNGAHADQFEVTVQNGKNVLQSGDEMVYSIKPKSNLQGGANYNANLVVSSNSQTNPEWSIPITLTALTPANMVLSIDKIVFGPIQGSQNPDPISITISNSGQSPLIINGSEYYSLSGDDADQFEVTIQNGKSVLQNGEEMIFTISSMADRNNGLNYNSILKISSNSAENSEVSIPIELTFKSNLGTASTSNLIGGFPVIGGSNLTSLIDIYNSNLSDGPELFDFGNGVKNYHVRNGGILIGRGRENWEWTDNGKGNSEEIRNIGNSDSFTPKYFSSADVNKILESSGLSLNDPSVKIILRRAANPEGTNYQIVEWKFVNEVWSWNMDTNSGQSLSSVIVEGVNHGGGLNTRDHNPSNDNQRVFTWGWGGHANKKGFSYGSAVNNGSSSGTSYLWESGNENHAIPYTEVYLVAGEWNEEPDNSSNNEPIIDQGTALVLDGADDHVALPNSVTSAIGGGEALTIEYWFKGTNIQSAVRLQNSNGYILAGWGSENRWIISTDGGTDNGLALSDSEIYDNNWHHIAMTWEKNQTDGFRLYLDGVLKKNRNSANVNLPNITNGGYIGCYAGNSERTSGSIDEVRIWNRALSSDEISSNMSCLRQPNSWGLVAYYNFDGNTLKNLVDNSDANSSGFSISSDDTWTNSFGVLSGNCATVNAPNLSNLALGGTVNAMNYYQNNSALGPRVVDGNTDGEWSHGSVYHNNGGSGPWIDIDLGSKKTITQFKLHNRTGCCQDRVGNYRMYISDTPFPNSHLNQASQDASTWVSSSRNDNNKLNWTISVGGANNIVKGRYVRFKMDESYSGYINLAEIEVIGY